MIRRVLLLVLAVVTCNAAAFAQGCPSGASWCSGTYAYDAMGNIRAIGADTYIYDTAGRLVSGTADLQRTGILSRQDYGYDTFGNRTSASRVAGSVDCLGGCEQSPAIDPVTNHITGNSAVYDAAGNLISITNTVNSTSFTSTYVYDSAGSMAQATAGSDVRQFIYTADDERIATRNGQSWTWTVRGPDNKVLREFTSLEPNGSPGLPTTARQWSKDYVWRDGLLLASVSASTSGPPITEHFHLDHLGTPRLVSNDNGVQMAIHAYYPFGAELNLSPETPVELMKFTGHERDQLASNPNTLDYMHARFEMATMGRFLSVDPVLGGPGSPQTWNRYTYTGNNPIKGTDPTGKCEQQDGAQPCSDGEITVTAKNPSDEEHFLFLQNETKELDLPFMGDWSSAHLFPNSLWGSYLVKQREKQVGHPTTPGAGVLLMGMALVGGGTGRRCRHRRRNGQLIFAHSDLLGTSVDASCRRVGPVSQLSRIRQRADL
ncbi:MAG TPA: RHS repeat-associated core domain-containing protein [Thermoanaerobaculia bacterium]|jgi:RHS repeat-associated protein|nr:RHS repeat-associated core domain-containing protein [Thermoanaerobaculia bacterium]